MKRLKGKEGEEKEEGRKEEGKEEVGSFYIYIYKE